MRRMAVGLVMALTLASCANNGAPPSTTGVPVDATPESADSTSTAPASAQSTDVLFPADDGLELSGTLRLPARAEAPGVVLIHGSGPQNRDQNLPGQLNMAFGFEIPVFAEIATALQAAGYAVLTYDKRSCGPFNNCAQNGYPLPPDDLTIDTFIADAMAAVRFLRSQPNVEGSQISAVGTSQGAEFIPVMLDSDPDLVKGVMIAAPFRPIDEIIEFQMTSSIDLLVEMGIAEEAARQQAGIAALQETVDGLERLREDSDEPVGGVSPSFWNSWFDLADRRVEVATRLSQPLLVVSGEMDWNVAPAETQAWADHLRGSAVPHETQVLPCITHALNCVTESNPAAITPADIGRNVDTTVLDTVIGFLDGE